MALREIIEIDEALCDGCGLCAQGCPEGALRLIEGKARMVGENLCDGLGACVGSCPRGAITIIRREAEDYEEVRVIEGIAALGPKVIAAHLEHLEHHGQDRYLREARAWLEARGIAAPASNPAPAPAAPSYPACPGTISRRLGPPASGPRAPSLGSPLGRAEPKPVSPAAAPGEGRKGGPAGAAASGLSSWPVQLHLINPRSAQFEEAELLVAADCTAYALGSFHRDYLAGRSLAIACPKLDQGRDIYLDKLSVLLDRAKSVSLLIMEVPCCSGLLGILLEARERSERRPPIALTVVGIEGEVLREETR